MQYEDKNGVNEPSRRRLLKGIGALALAEVVRSLMHKKRKVRRVRFHRMHAMRNSRFMVSIRRDPTPQQAAMMLVAFDVLASDKPDSRTVVSLVDSAFCFSDSGRSGTRSHSGACHHSIPAFLAATLRPIISPSRYRWVTIV
ncbi:hypothetical protein ACLB1M_10175 [Escherichia coli]